jgi:hypothetical protein
VLESENTFIERVIIYFVGMFFNSAIFLKKIGSETHSDPKFGRRGGGVNYIDARKKKRSWNVVRLTSF